jgi:hypothetical protein
MTSLPTLGEWQPIGALAPQPAAEPVPTKSQQRRWSYSRVRDTGLGVAGFVIVLTVAVAGWSASFIGLHDFAVRHMGLNKETGWLVPITFDGAPLGLTLVVYRASLSGRSAVIWRTLIFTFTGLSSWINWQHIDDPTGRWIASFMPPAAVVLFEGLMSEARATAAKRPRLHPLRWFIDWSGTWAMYRAYVMGIELPQHLTKDPPERSQKESRALTETPRERAHDTSGERPDERSPEALSERQGERPERPQSERARKPSGERRERAQKKPKKSAGASAKKSTTALRRERARRLYDELGRRPEWTEIRDVLVAEQLADKNVSRPTIQRVRDAIERDEPALAALGTDNVRALNDQTKTA